MIQGTTVCSRPGRLDALGPDRLRRAHEDGVGFGAVANDPEVSELVETAKPNGVEEHAHLTSSFERLSHVKAVEDFEGVLRGP
jgi:hypothetical protein